MVNLTVALEELKVQLIDVVRTSLERGFELVAGVTGGKLAKVADQAVKDAAKKVELEWREEFAMDVGGLMAMVKANATTLRPFLVPVPKTSRIANFTEEVHVVTCGISKSGIRAFILNGPCGKPFLWSEKHSSTKTALADLLALTQKLLKRHMTDLFEPIVSPPVAKPASKPASKIESARSTNVYKCWNGSRAPDSPTELSSPSLSDEETSASYKLFWDDDTLTNKDFHASGGFNYAAFGARDGSPDSGFESDGSATLVNPTAGSRGGWS